MEEEQQTLSQDDVNEPASLHETTSNSNDKRPSAIDESSGGFENIKKCASLNSNINILHNDSGSMENKVCKSAEASEREFDGFYSSDDDEYFPLENCESDNSIDLVNESSPPNDCKFSTLPHRRSELIKRNSLKRATFSIGAKEKLCDTNKSPEKTKRNFSWLRKSMKKLNPITAVKRTDSSASANEINQSCASAVTATTTNATSSLGANILSALMLEAHHHQTSEENHSRLRQFGRRSNPLIVAPFNDESFDNNNGNAIIAHHHRRRTTRRNGDATTHSEPSSIASSRNQSPVSILSTTSASSIADNITINNIVENESNNASENDDGDAANSNDKRMQWPIYTRPFCCLACIFGLFNGSRFAIFSIHFGANFLLQFFILSLIFGIPFLCLLIVLGQRVKKATNIVTLFRISPICQGIGLGLFLTHCIISLYTSVGVSYVLVYLKDSFVYNDGNFKWQERFDLFRGHQNYTYQIIAENIADYFNGNVLHRLTTNQGSSVRFQLVLNVLIVWLIIFCLLIRGIRSFGKLTTGMLAISFTGLFAVCIKVLTLIDFDSVESIFPATNWSDFFANAKSWEVAAQECFLTWLLLGVSIFSIYCKENKSPQHGKSLLKKEICIIILGAFVGLFLSALLGSTCIQILTSHGYIYQPASYENTKRDIFLWWKSYSIPSTFHHSMPPEYITRFPMVLGESFQRPPFIYQYNMNYHRESGYKPLRLLIEILPSTFAICKEMQKVWAVIGFASFFLIGVVQLAAMIFPISKAIGNSTFSILVTCVVSVFLTFPLLTENGISIIHFLDFIFGGAWWLLILWTFFLISIFMVRGRPYTSDVLIKELNLNQTCSAFLAFSWNMILPVGMICLSIMEYKTSNSAALFSRKSIQNSYSLSSNLANMQVWARKLGAFLQLSFLIVFIPLVALIQIYRYLSRGPRDILERLKLLYRPNIEASEHMPVRRLVQTRNRPQQSAISIPLNNNLEDQDPPPYSPPPSYSKITGKFVAEVIRNSIRRSMRRLARRNQAPANEIFSLPTVSSANLETSTNNQHNMQSTEALVGAEVTLNVDSAAEINRLSSAV